MIAERIAAVQRNITLAQARSPLAADSVKLIAVTKNHDVAAMQAALAAGIIAVGENRVQEAMQKEAVLGRTVEWHLLGHLQTNKVRQAVPLFDLIHSLDSERLAKEINRVAGNIGKRQNVLIQVNIGNEETKFGIDRQQLLPFVRLVNQMEHVQVCGLMAIAPAMADSELARPYFREMRALFEETKQALGALPAFQCLSMGMTNDYSVAIEEGATLVRVGTAIFGERQYVKGG